MTWWLHALCDGDSIRFPLDGGALGTPAGPGLPFDALGDDEIGRADDLVFSLAGDGPSFDLAVRDGDSTVTLTGADLTQRAFCHAPALDLVVVVEGDPGTTISRNLLLVPLAPVRDALASGKAERPLSLLDPGRIRGAQNGLDLESTEVSIRALAGHGELLVFANRPRAQPSVADLQVFALPGFVVGAGLAGTPVSAGPRVELSGFWLCDIVGGRLPDGRVRAVALGVARKRRDFVLEVRTLTTDEPEGSLLLASREGGPTAHVQADVELRDSSGVKALAALPDAAGALLLAEDPLRRRHLLRVDVDDTGVVVRELELDPMPWDLRVTAEDVTPAATAGDDGEEPDDDLVRVDAAGRRVPLGALGADAWPEVSVVAVDAPDDAGLRWWVGEEGGEYALHLSADRPVQVRWRLG